MTPRPNHQQGTGGSPQRGGQHEEKEYIRTIQAATSLSQISIEDIAKEDGLAEQAAKNFRDLKPSQLRRFFGAVKKIEYNLADDSWSAVEADFYMIRPLLAYAEGRSLIPRDFYTLVTVAMQKVPVGDDAQKKKNYKTFVNLLESVVAYHKYYYPKERT